MRMQTQIGCRPPLAWLGLPAARAQVRGDAAHRELRGTVEFYRARPGLVVVGEFYGLPCGSGADGRDFFAVRVYPGAAAAPGFGRVEPGELPPLLASRGYAFQAVYTERFPLPAALGGLLTVHACGAAGAAGDAIGCGAILRAR